MRVFIHALLFFSLFTPLVAAAAIEAYEFRDAQMEADYTRLINELRCLVCQNQNLSGSDADLARDLRRQTHEMLMEGNNADQVVQFMVERYGDFVLYRPQFQLNTYLLWIGPFFLATLALLIVFLRLRRKQVLVEPDNSSLQRAKALLSEDLTSNKRDH